jgi:hypothetical protein
MVWKPAMDPPSLRRQRLRRFEWVLRGVSSKATTIPKVLSAISMFWEEETVAPGGVRFWAEDQLTPPSRLLTAPTTMEG